MILVAVVAGVVLIVRGRRLFGTGLLLLLVVWLGASIALVDNGQQGGNGHLQHIGQSR
ncbi:MAG: hypothetical protein ACREN7_00790 [Candidatus Dormibacteria bacterium]